MPRDTNNDLTPPQPMDRRKRLQLELAIKGYADGDMMLAITTIRALLRAVDYHEQDAAELVHQNAMLRSAMREQARTIREMSTREGEIHEELVTLRKQHYTT